MCTRKVYNIRRARVVRRNEFKLFVFPETTLPQRAL